MEVEHKGVKDKEMIVGIDLGTTNSLIAYFTEEGPKIIPNRLGKNLTPSVVSVDEEGNVYVGETAKERMSLYPDSVAQTFKRSMGTEREYVLSGKRFKPEELSSMVIRALKEDAEAFLGEEITEVPHNYTGVLTSLKKVEFRMAISAVTREYTPGSCHNSRNRIRCPPRWEMRLDSPALHAEQSRIPNQTRKEPRFS